MRMRNLIRVVSELVSNIVKHSDANNAHLEMHASEDRIELRLSNDGPSSNPADWQVGVGLDSSIRRVEEAGGEIQWIPNPNEVCPYPQGTTAVLIYRV